MTTKPKVTMKRAIELQCHDCLGFYEDGKMDCENVRCPLYTYMPYRKKEPDLEKFLYSARAVGKVLMSKRREVGKEKFEKAKKEGKIKGKIK